MRPTQHAASGPMARLRLLPRALERADSIATDPDRSRQVRPDPPNRAFRRVNLAAPGGSMTEHAGCSIPGRSGISERAL